MALDEKSSKEYPVNVGVHKGSILGPIFFLLYINGLPDDVICNMAIYPDDITRYSKCDQHLICDNSFLKSLESPVVDLYVYKSTIWPYMEYCFMSGLVLLAATLIC